jgi:hypothetical protein
MMAPWRQVTILLCLLLLCLVRPLTAGSAEGSEFDTYTPERLVAEYGKAVVLIAASKEGGKILSLGSGFIVTSDGQLVTNYHVVKGAFPILVKLPSGDVYDDIGVVDHDARRDPAVIKVKGFNLPTVALGNSDDVKVGEQVVVIGNPEGLENTVSDGLLSGIRDTGKGYSQHQITAPISHGSSGSPVFNRRGQVIGVAVATVEAGQNLNFSIPVNYARGLIGGPAKLSLRDLPVEEAPDVGGGPVKVVPKAEAAGSLVAGITYFLQAIDGFAEGSARSHSAGTQRSGLIGWRFVQADVYSTLYAATRLFEKARDALSGTRDQPGELGDLAAKYLSYAVRASDEHRAFVDLLTGPARQNMGALLTERQTAVGFVLTDAIGEAVPTLPKAGTSGV